MMIAIPSRESGHVVATKRMQWWLAAWALYVHFIMAVVESFAAILKTRVALISSMAFASATQLVLDCNCALYVRL